MADLENVRARREDLHQVIVSVEAALAAPASGRPESWLARVHEVLVDLGASFERHIAATEGPGGLFDSIMRASPRLANGVDKLREDHHTLRSRIADLLVEARTAMHHGGPTPAALREEALVTLTELSRHRQLGADLVYECYAVDIGGGD